MSKKHPLTPDCGPECDCHTSEPLVEVGNKVYTNTNGGAGPSDHLKEMIAKNNNKPKNLKIVQKKG
jgi:hypothetical protein